MGIVKNMTEEEKYASLEVVKYFTSKEYQSNMFRNRLCLTSHTEVLNDKEICKNAPCDLVKEIQFTGEPLFIKKGPQNYSKKYKQYIYQFLYNNESINRILKYINDVTKTYYISLNTENSYVGFTVFIFISVVSALMILSLIVVFNDNFQPFLMFLPTGFWISQFWGFTFNLCSIICKLISQLPEENKLSVWVGNNKYLFILLNVLMDVLFNSISLIDKYSIKLVVVENGENFEIFISALYLDILSFVLLVLLGILKKQDVKLQFINSINDKFINNNIQIQIKSYTGSFNDNSYYKNTLVEENDDDDVNS
ncbi:hypothetical protein BCR32DRAFT_283426 [Anaeromyces robustus]|uniref:Uncharacterized protein n=1 Tax=Anaeromyces robustus TaxID=1754192 RepID=A0A1Y1WUU4_9FUNG|nr:hypothetical protein BCR32DRAFT_283426 [Anaeromyces robustus]|eukprot:ORX77175.1 hypothetical protein BCR32DRAFT_283426 [Anaeromyces robustus]